MADELTLYCVYRTYLFEEVGRNGAVILFSFDLRSQQSFVEIGDRIYIEVPLHILSARLQGPGYETPQLASMIGLFRLPPQHKRGVAPTAFVTRDDLENNFAVLVKDRARLGEFGEGDQTGS